MSLSVSRAALTALLPPGSIWQPGEGFAETLDGMGQNFETVRLFLADLAVIRNALRTPILSDLEKEYGIFDTGDLTEDERRQRLLAIIVARDSDGTAQFMEDALRASGFDVFVHVNDPAVDPTLFLNETFLTILGNSTAILGRSDAQLGGANRADLVVNGDVVFHPHILSMIVGNKWASMGSTFSVLGALNAIENVPIEYDIPTEPGYWSLFFFVGGPATRNATTGALETIERAEIPASRRDEFRRLIVRYKPMYTWGELIVDFV